MTDGKRAQPFVRDGVGYIPLRRKDGSAAAWAVVDLADFEDVARFNWSQASNGYAQRGSGKGRGVTCILMHRYLLGLSPGDGMVGDHIDRDRLNHRRENLRALPSIAANRQNTSSRGGTSSYRGVNWSSQRGKWTAEVMVAGRRRYQGFFTSEQEAAEAAAAARRTLMPLSVIHK
jgi:hypothetical protein